MSEPLWQIDAFLQRALDEAAEYAAEHDGEIPDDLAQKIDALEWTLELKAEQTALAYKNLTAEAKMVREELKALQKRAQSAEKLAERLKGYLDRVLNHRPIKTSKVAISWRRSTAVEIEEGAKINAQYLKVWTEPMKADIMRDLRLGKEVPGATLVERQNIQVR